MTTVLILAGASVAIAAMLCFTALRAWRGWLDLRRLELAQRRAGADEEDHVGVRIELAAVRERLKKLEAIASGVEL
jgi:hypothetical protein